MLTNVQKETLNALINLYQSSDGKPIKGKEIADVLNNNPGTIRNQMINLRRLGLVKSVFGPVGGYKPTMEAYHSLNISVSDNDYAVPVYKNGKIIKDMSVARMEFTGLSKSSGCEVSIKVLGSIKNFSIGEEIVIGPTPVNNLSVMGTIVGREDLENILLVDTKTIRSIPKKTVGDIASRDVTSFKVDDSIRDAAKKLTKKEIDGAPVINEEKVVGVFTLTDLVNAIANGEENATVGDLMSSDVSIVKEDLKIANAIEVLLKKSISRLIIVDNDQKVVGIVTRTDLIGSIVNLEEFPL